eukprot:m.113165 g.113165  ORF g.113165 m.113165 type:complete len:152 (+) comp9128_c1_seq1:470-925(+)
MTADVTDQRCLTRVTSCHRQCLACVLAMTTRYKPTARSMTLSFFQQDSYWKERFRTESTIRNSVRLPPIDGSQRLDDGTLRSMSMTSPPPSSLPPQRTPPSVLVNSIRTSRRLWSVNGYRSPTPSYTEDELAESFGQLSPTDKRTGLPAIL